ncbi:MAG: 2-amino-4-hydroxy-6-hydroxymethyldihydropteridine diphosphokinase [Pseudomonadota bacterium]
MTLKRAEVLVALGSNQPSHAGNALQTVAFAMDELQKAGGQIAAKSEYYQTSAFPAGSGPDFVNAAARLAWDASPLEILNALHAIEASLGRERAHRWAPRTVDLDLIAVGDAVLPDAKTHQKWRLLPPDRQAKDAPDRLILPHPRLQDRPFVLVPLAEVAPSWVHPVLGLDVRTLLSRCDAAEIADVRVLDQDGFAVVNKGDSA